MKTANKKTLMLKINKTKNIINALIPYFEYKNNKGNTVKYLTS
jgi:hypothetical protein